MFNSPSTRSRLATPRFSTAPTPTPPPPGPGSTPCARRKRPPPPRLSPTPPVPSGHSLMIGIGYDSILAHVDEKSGYAVVAASRTCIAWNYAKRTQSTPTTYTFSAPPPANATSLGFIPPILSALYTPSSSASLASEPGMILISSSGEVRFWESLSLALGNVDRYQELFLELQEGDWVEKVYKLDGTTFLLTTSTSQIYRLTIALSGGRAVPTVNPLSKPAGMFGRASQQLFGSRYDREGVRSVAVHGEEVFILASRSVQKWSFGGDSQKFVQEYDLYDAVGNAISDIYISGTVALELDDIAPFNPSSSSGPSLAVLATYAEPHSHPSHVILTISFTRNTLPTIHTVFPINHWPQAGVDGGRKVVIPGNSSMALVKFDKGVVIKSLEEGEEGGYEEVLNLKDPRNTILSLNPISTPAPTVVAVPALGGMMSITALEPLPQEVESERGRGRGRLESKMRGAVWFGERGDNPLSFRLDDGDEGDEDVAGVAERVSADVVSNTSRYTPSIPELRTNLQDKLSKLKHLMQFIHTNGLMAELPQKTRRTLSGDAEMVRGGLELWDYQDRVMEQMTSQPSKNLLSSSIQTYFSTYPPAVLPSSPSYNELVSDPVRFFFRHAIPQLPVLLGITFARYQAAISDLSSDRAGDLGEVGEVGQKSAWLAEINQIFITVERAAAQYREEESELYGVDREKPAEEMWTASDELLGMLEELYARTEAGIKERTRVLGSVIDEPPASSSARSGPGGNEELKKEQVLQGMLKRQMGWLAAVLCTNMEDKCRVVVRRQMNEGVGEEEGIAIKERWDEMKPRVIRPLVAIDRITEAFELAEHHHDYPTLVVLCNDPLAAQGRSEARIQLYIERFGEDFAFELYRWYIAQGRAYELLTQDEVYGGLVSRFFETHGYNELAWVHDVGCGRYGEAAGALVDVLEKETSGHGKEEGELEYRKIVASIAKLAEMTDISKRGADEEKDRTFQQIGQHLSLIDVQASLLAYFSALLPSHPRPPNRKHLPKHLAPILTLLSSPADAPRESFQALFIDLVSRLVCQGEALGLEGVVDLLVMKDNVDREEDAVEALRLVVLDQTLPKARSEVALISIWRRIYIRDDWRDISNTGGRSEQAQRARLRQTMIYKVLKSLHTIPDFPSAAIIPPYDATIPPTATELSARFPTFAPDVIRELEGDYEKEVGVLVGYVEEGGLEERVGEVERLVGSDLEAEGNVDGVVGDDDVEM
ncbi:hypothetical protein IAR50_006990 [Cryptococcus sp. DSM 104548]